MFQAFFLLAIHRTEQYVPARRIIYCLAFMGALICAGSPDVASAGRLPVGDGETIKFLAKLPASPGALAYTASGMENLGYKFSEFNIGFPVWTWGGQYVAYNGDRYVSLGRDAKTIAEQLGMGREQLWVPLTYKVPFGWWLIGGFLLFSGARFVTQRRALRTVTKRRSASGLPGGDPAGNKS